MTAKPKPRKAPVINPVPKPGARDVIVTIQHRDKLNDTIHLLNAVELAVSGSELGDFEQCAINELVRLINSRLRALDDEFAAPPDEKEPA
jgi:hypothetical protein